jgi:hypothetical protein
MFRTLSPGPTNGSEPPTFLGLPAMEGYALLLGILVVAASATALGVIRRRRRRGAVPEAQALSPAATDDDAPPS